MLPGHLGRRARWIFENRNLLSIFSNLVTLMILMVEFESYQQVSTINAIIYNY